MQDAAIGIVLLKQDPTKVLWVKRRDLAIWVLPGGGIDEGETALEAVKREIFEESQIQVLSAKQTAFLKPVNRYTAATSIFVCETDQFNPKTTIESAAVGFFKIDLPPLPHFPLHYAWLKENLSSKEFIERPIEEFSWLKVGAFFLKHPLTFIKYLMTRS